MADDDGFPGGALEDIAYLARSEHRAAALEALGAEPHRTRDLEEAVGASRSTLSRILTEFEERGWAERTRDGDYEATVQGELAVAEFTRVVEAMDAIRELGELAAILPTDELSIGLHHFQDASVRRPSASEPAGRYLASAIRDAETFRVLTWLAPPGSIGTAMEEGVRSGRLTLEGIHRSDLNEYIFENPDGPPDWQALLEAGAEFYDYDGDLPCSVYIVDETVFIDDVRLEQVSPGTLIESRNPAVRDWALDLIETYRERADPITTEEFTE